MDEVQLQVHRYRLSGIAEEMGQVLQQTSFSPNIKERRDFSCALVDEAGRLVAQAAHIPVHLGAIPTTMRHFLEEVDPTAGAGYLLNDPYRGGTHLPDLSYVEPWQPDGEIRGYVINRAHHTDVGGAKAGSMTASRHIDEEGFRTGPRRIADEQGLSREQIKDFLRQTRNPDQRVTDLEAQIAAARRGRRRLVEWYRSLPGPPGDVFEGLIAYSRRYIRNLIDRLPDGTFEAVDRMDDDGVGGEPARLHLDLRLNERSIVADYRGSDDQVPGNINCPRAVVCSATYYVIQALLPEQVPANQGILEPVSVRTRPGSILHVEYPGAVAGGNVETSQRVVDVLLKAFNRALPGRIPAASQGTMNNVTFGWEDPDGAVRTYYETLGGGGGGGPDHPGVSARQVHMTNTLNTPIEEFERNLPLRVEELRIRGGSGGEGQHPGGEGLIKSWTALREVRVGLLSERRRFAPYGLNGGGSGKVGENVVVDSDGDSTRLAGKTDRVLRPGQTLRVKTPGGGGWNPPPEEGEAGTPDQ